MSYEKSGWLAEAEIDIREGRTRGARDFLKEFRKSYLKDRESPGLIIVCRRGGHPPEENQSGAGLAGTKPPWFCPDRPVFGG